MTTTDITSDLDRLLRLVGMLGSPNEDGFWDTWRSNLDGYSFKKMKAYVTRSSDPADPSKVHYLASYTLKFFSTSSADEEAALVGKLAGYVSPHEENQPALQWLDDLRRTAWRLYRDTHPVSAKDVVADWEQAQR